MTDLGLTKLMKKKNLNFAALGLFFQSYCKQQQAAYTSASASERKEMSGFMRHLRREVGMSQRVINGV